MINLLDEEIRDRRKYYNTIVGLTFRKAFEPNILQVELLSFLNDPAVYIYYVAFVFSVAVAEARRRVLAGARRLVAADQVF